jgi:single-stranded-DNA-specific exonuclease
MRQADRIVRTSYANDNGFVLYNKNWHAGVVGIVSVKLSKDYGRPCIVLGNERGFAKGSGRSIGDVNLIDVLGECAEFLESWGGHPYAVGVAIAPKNIDQFREKFNGVIGRHSCNQRAEKGVNYAMELNLEDINGNFSDELELMEPFGHGNPEPTFLLKGVKIEDLPEKFGAQKTHVRFWLVDRHSKRMLVIGWNAAASNIPPIRVPLDIVVTVNREEWNGTISTRLHMVDWRLADA